MEITADVLFMLFMDGNKWGKVVANAERNNITARQALINASKDVVIENYDYSLLVSWADEICNWMDSH
ncbi:MAG: hypothetical protein KA974_10245 [Saprospiraceae bacterium]|nr:hypothetical protein [Saprospiraceae bacterium]